MRLARRAMLAVSIGLLGQPVRLALAQQADSVVVAAEARYDVGWLRRQFFGGHYRGLWKTPVKFPVLDLQHFAGGLHADKVGGGLQTRSLRFTSPSGDYTFRPLRKDSIDSAHKYRNTIVEAVLKDAVASTHPAGAILTDPLLSAAGVLHPHPQLVVMPDDPALGKFRQEFANMLGAIEEHPTVPDHGSGFAGAAEIIDSDELLKLINQDPDQQIDARAFLRARLVDMLVNDWDRHPGQWKWARGGKLGTAWQPISRDRDRAFVSYSGILPSIARMMLSNATPFRGEPPRVKGLIYNSLALDRRLLLPLEKTAWDSVVQELVRNLSDAVIDSAFARIPPVYQALEPDLVPKLRLRRDGLPRTATDFFQVVNRVADIHATDAAEVAGVRLLEDGTVRVELRKAPGAKPYFARQFSIAETREVRLYLHGGDDRAVVSGTAPRSVKVRVIGGGGNNVLIDSSRVSGHPAARLYDNGRVKSVEYGPDTLFNRRPWVTRFGEKVPPGQDYGAKVAPIISLSLDRDVGVVPRIGVSYTTFGFLRRPYARRLTLTFENSTRIGHSRLIAAFDRQLEDSRVHWMVSAAVSDLEVISFHGLGNGTPGGAENFFEVDQRQWSLQPSIGVRISTKNDLSFGPVFKYSTMNSDANTFVNTSRPYGSGDFGTAGVALRFHLDERNDPVYPSRGLRAEVEAALYPAVWDVQSTFGSVHAIAMGYFRIPVPSHPVLALRVGGKKVMGDFPFYEAAFLGGGATIHNLTYQRYAGDTEVDGTVELRFHVANVHLLLPLDVGLFPLVETGRVWSNGASPGGWHSAYGGGIWIGLPDPSKSISISVTDGNLNRLFVRAGLTF
ncbi:MAG: BamA/TamA family outer membrane protein [Gemmatimonadota bacterium]